MKNKYAVYAAGIIVLAIGTYLVASKFMGGAAEVVPAGVDAPAGDVSSLKPDRKNDIYGNVIRLDGNIVTVAKSDPTVDPTFGMSSEDKRKYMQSLGEEERTALKEKIRAAVIGEVRVLVPVGIPMTKKQGEGPDAPEVEATLSDIAVGSALSVWLDQGVSDRDVAEFVRITAVR
jgi:hypothetical protein